MTTHAGAPAERDPRVLAQAHLRPRFIANGVDANDVDEIFEVLRAWSDWCPTWKAVADRHDARGEKALADGHRATAADAFLYASALYHFGCYLSPGDADYYQLMARRSAESYRRALPLMDPAGESYEVPFEHSSLKCWLRRPGGIDRPPVVLLLPGLEANKEELHGLGEAVVRRGLAAIGIDGPGQGECEQDWPMPVDFERAVSAVIDHLPPGLGSIGVLGISLGGYWAPRAAAFDERIQACVPICGPYDWSRSWPTVAPLLKVSFCAKVRCSMEDAPKRAADFTLAGVTERIQCPMLVVHAGLDRVILPSEGEQLAAEVPGSSLVILKDANHVCHNRHYEMRPLVSDWLAATLQRSSE